MWAGEGGFGRFLPVLPASDDAFAGFGSLVSSGLHKAPVELVGLFAQVDNTEELATTIGLYVLGEISLGKAAERTGVTRWEMEEILSETGIEVRLGPQNRDDFEDEVETALDLE